MTPVQKEQFNLIGEQTMAAYYALFGDNLAEHIPQIIEQQACTVCAIVSAEYRESAHEQAHALMVEMYRVNLAIAHRALKEAGY